MDLTPDYVLLVSVSLFEGTRTFTIPRMSVDLSSCHVSVMPQDDCMIGKCCDHFFNQKLSLCVLCLQIIPSLLSQKCISHQSITLCFVLIQCVTKDKSKSSKIYITESHFQINVTVHFKAHKTVYVFAYATFTCV